MSLLNKTNSDLSLYWDSGCWIFFSKNRLWKCLIKVFHWYYWKVWSIDFMVEEKIDLQEIAVSYLLSWLSNLIYQAIAPLLCGGIIEQLSPTQSPTLTNPYPVKQDQAIKCTFPPCDSVCFSMAKYLISHHFCDFFFKFYLTGW